MTGISPDIEAALAGLSDAEWSALTAKVRAPDGTEALRTAAAQLLTGDALNAFVTGADPAKFLNVNGEIDANRVLANIRAAYGAGNPSPGYVTTDPRSVNYGQGGPAGAAPRLRPGDGGRIAAAKRHSTPLADETAAAVAPMPGGRGSAGRAAAARRFPQKESQ